MKLSDSAVTKVYTCECGASTLVTRSTENAHENQIVNCYDCGKEM